MKLALALLGLLIGMSGCGGGDDGNSGSASGGTGATVGGSNGGASSSAAGGLSSSTLLSGGASQGGARTTVVPGQPCTGTCPTGSVESCSGNFCPYGKCGAPWDTYKCSAFYPEPVNPSTVYCTAGSTGGYCLVTNQTTTQDYWAINCSGGTPNISECETGCQVDANNVAACP